MSAEKIGKRVGSNRYIHAALRGQISGELEKRIAFAEQESGAQFGVDYNVVRYSETRETISFLSYGSYFDDPFPVLKESCLVNVLTGKVSKRDYSVVNNPPILHRKELLLPADHPSVSEFSALTRVLEDAGLFSDVRRIGTQKIWEFLVREAGLGWIYADPKTRTAEVAKRLASRKEVLRHRTAISRTKLSLPFQCLERHGYLEKNHTIFDYGCGKGGDVDALEEQGIEAIGWDPHYRPDNNKISSDVVNIGYVINVIEVASERAEVLKEAFDLANMLLVVSAQLNHQRNPTHRSYRDGVITSRDTFQKYYDPTELKELLHGVVGIEPIPVAPGVFFLFKDKLAEQSFLEKRQRRTLSHRKPRVVIPKPTAEEKNLAKYNEHQPLLEALYERWLELGRSPYLDEIPDLAGSIEEAFRTLNRALKFLVQFKGEDEIREAARSRSDDVLVYLALNLFHGRPRYTKQPLNLQRDIKQLFGSHGNALEQARSLLFSLNNAETIFDLCNEASQSGLGYLDEQHSLTVHSSVVNELSAPLRLYVGCADHLYGDRSEADLVKIHILSGKLSLMKFDDFDNQPLPKLIERVKIKLREQDIDYFDYGILHEPPYLFNKSQYIGSSCVHFAEQKAFEEDFLDLGFIEDDQKPPTVADVAEKLAARGVEIDGFRIKPRLPVMNLDQHCGKYLTYRDLIECGDTQRGTQLTNIPAQQASFAALYELARQALDPVIDYFGMIRLTYGFCSHALSRKIPNGIAPRLDQHSSCELNTRGQVICDRGGAAVDFVIEDEDMHEVAVWIIENIQFDRLYFYGLDRPLHVSVGPENSRAVVWIKQSQNGKRIPKTLTTEKFKRL
jgi:DNA phosphorothioation-associated putative methyltransferase